MNGVPKIKGTLYFGLLAIPLLLYFYSPLLFSDPRLAKENLWTDEWDYQIYGVNLAHGFGFRGKALPFEAYDLTKADRAYYKSFMKSSTGKNDVAYFRPPGYTFFLSLIYRAAGVQPMLVKSL